MNKFSPDQVKLSSKPKQTNLQLKTLSCFAFYCRTKQAQEVWNLAGLGPRTGPGNTSKRKKDAVEEIKKSGENCPVEDIR